MFFSAPSISAIQRYLRGVASSVLCPEERPETWDFSCPALGHLARGSLLWPSARGLSEPGDAPATRRRRPRNAADGQNLFITPRKSTPPSPPGKRVDGSLGGFAGALARSYLKFDQSRSTVRYQGTFGGQEHHWPYRTAPCMWLLLRLRYGRARKKKDHRTWVSALGSQSLDALVESICQVKERIGSRTKERNTARVGS